MQEAIPYRSYSTTWISPTAIYAAPRSGVLPPPVTEGISASLFPSSPSSSSSSSSSASSYGGDGGMMRRMVEENPVVVVCRKGCCLSHVARRLLLGLGVNPAVCEFGDEAAGEAAVLVEDAPEVEIAGGDLRRPSMLPVVFVGGRLLGGLDRLVAAHITGELVPILKDAGALWL